MAFAFVWHRRFSEHCRCTQTYAFSPSFEAGIWGVPVSWTHILQTSSLDVHYQSPPSLPTPQASLFQLCHSFQCFSVPYFHMCLWKTKMPFCLITPMGYLGDSCSPFVIFWIWKVSKKAICWRHAAYIMLLGGDGTFKRWHPVEGS